MHSENQNPQSVVYQMLIIGASDDAVFAKDTETDDLFRIDKHELMVTRIAELPVDELSIFIADEQRIHGYQAYEQRQEFWQQFREIRVTVFNNKLLYFDAPYINETPNTQESQPSLQRKMTPQHHLELDETTLKSTGKSVDINAVIAKIDALTADK